MSDPLNLLDTLTDRIGADHARAAIDEIATWAWAQASLAEHAPGPHAGVARRDARAYRHLARTMISYGATTGQEQNLSEHAAAVWRALADAGHTPAADSLTGDGYQISYLPGAVMVSLVRGAALSELPYAAVQRQTLQGWADSLAAAGYQPRPVGDPDAPRALRVPPQNSTRPQTAPAMEVIAGR